MVPFMIYLLETGICLSLLYLAYWLFLRKETYFNFNRIFLVGSIALSLLVPAIHMDVRVNGGSSLAQTATGIETVRDSYEEMIRMINADYGTEPGARHSTKRSGTVDSGMAEGGSAPLASDEVAVSDTHRGISISRILLIIYICGVAYFFARFVYLVIRLYLLARRNRVTQQDGFRMVEIDEQISPFSFFSFLFINNGSFDEPDLHQVLEHEKAHISQKHSIDHLFAHTLAVFQWFNPIAWQIRKALKTTHEYIADRHVIDRGVERHDYQSLLLKQVIGYHSVELVNNFNLNPIKKRIAMMNKTKSGIPARFKAALVAPFAILVFFLFADFTLKGSSVPDDPTKELEGLWIKQSNDDFSDKVLIKDGVFSYTDEREIRQFDILSLRGGEIVLRFLGFPDMKYRISGDELVLFWNPRSETRYTRSDATNTLDQYLKENQMDMELPAISRYRLLENEKQVYRIGVGTDRSGRILYTINGKKTALANISNAVNRELGELSTLDASAATGIFLVDRGVAMSEVVKVRDELRAAKLYRVAEGGYPHGDLDLSPLLYHSVGLVRLLPPLDAKVLEKQNEWVKGATVTAQGRQRPIHTIDLSARNTTPRDVDENLREFIADSPEGKYIISLEYDGDIPYGQYVETVDMIYNVVYDFRDTFAMEKYGASYDKLGNELQKEIRKAYPIALSENLKEGQN